MAGPPGQARWQAPPVLGLDPRAGHDGWNGRRPAYVNTFGAWYDKPAILSVARRWGAHRPTKRRIAADKRADCDQRLTGCSPCVA